MKNTYIIPNWPAPAHVKAYSTTRLGGVSQPPFDSLNLGLSVNDHKQHVLVNRHRMMTDLGVPAEPLWLHQVHGNVAVCSNEAGTLPKADASFTTKVNTPCLVMTADCLPILLTNREGTCVAALHAGWRGLAHGVIANSLERMSAAFPESHWLAWLGPAIGPDVFEVGDEVREAFVSIDSDTQTAFRHTKPGKWLANLYAIARILLQRQGIHQIYGGDYCTYSDAKHFFSHRRDRGMTGRMASLIWFTNP